MKRIFYLLAFLAAFEGVSQKKRLIDLYDEWLFTIGDREEFAEPDFDDHNWEKIKVPSPWESEGFANYNGYAWYRYHFNGKDLNGFTNLVIRLGYIDDVHEAYLNGQLIGFKGSFPPDFYTAYDARNEYAIPNELINASGDNVIAIKVYDITKEGGLIKGDFGIYFEPKIPEDFLNLEGVWKFTTQAKSNWESPELRDSDWENIVVPSFWKSKHIRNSRGFAWYRKSFELPSHLKGKDLYLILGVIDDFDYTYVNGEIIGRTKDFRPFGESESWQELRIYRIPKEKLNQNGENVIAVQVENLGLDAGIYQGPVGLVNKLQSKENYKKR